MQADGSSVILDKGTVRHDDDELMPGAVLHS